MLVAIIKPNSTESLSQIITLINKTKLKHSYIVNNNLIMVALKTYNENTFLILNLLLKHIKKNYGKIELKTIYQTQFAKTLKNYITEFISSNILRIPVKPLYLPGECPVCFELLTYKPPQTIEEQLLKIKNISTLEYYTPLVNKTTICTNPTRTYSYPFRVSLPVLLASMKSKINHKTPLIEPNIIQLITDSRSSETTIYLLNKRDTITIKRIGLDDETTITTKQIKSNYTHELNDLKPEIQKQIKKFMLHTDLLRLTGDLEYMTKCKELIQVLDKPDSYLNKFKKIKIKYYTLDDNTIIIDTITILTESRE